MIGGRCKEPQLWPVADRPAPAVAPELKRQEP
jgi:hypothetical protein